MRELAIQDNLLMLPSNNSFKIIMEKSMTMKWMMETTAMSSPKEQVAECCRLNKRC